MDLFWQYYGLDSLGMLLSLLAMYMIGNQNRWGFVVFAVANVLWVYLGVYLMDSIGIAVGNLIFLIINVRGYLRWVGADTEPLD